MAFQEKQLGQRRDNDTDTHSIYSPDSGVVAVVRCIVIANTTAAIANIRIFMDDDGTTYDQSTALLYDVAIGANATAQIDGFYPMNNSSGNLAYQQGTANACTVTVFGAEIS
jgi:hypothetical protein